MSRIDGRKYDELRPVKLTPGFTKFAEGSCLIELGNTVVLCNASIEDKVPPHVRQGGWVTAEYSMLPRANRERSRRDISKLKLSSRSAEIQRLIGRSLRCAVDLSKLGERTVIIDCDVLQGDGGTRTASVIGGAQDAPKKSPLELFEELYRLQNGAGLNAAQRTYLKDKIEALKEVEG